MAEPSHFAREINALLEQSSLSAEDLVADLNKRGFPLPLDTFNYWRQGYFLPRSDGAFQLISIMESICGGHGNRLSDALLYDLSSGASFVPGHYIAPESSTPPTLNTRLTRIADKAIDWDANLIQKAVRDIGWISADYRKARFTTTVFAHVPSVPNPTFVFQLLLTPHEPVPTEDYFYNLSGMTLQKQEIFREDDGTISCVTQFSVPESVAPGDLHKLSFSWDEESEKPFDMLNERLFPWSVEFYSCKVTFEGGIPDDIRYVTHKTVDGQEVEVPHDIPMIRDGNTVSVSMKNVANVIGSFRYSVPTD